MSCPFDKDQTFIVQDYGPVGYVGSTAVNLTYGLKPGSVLSTVVKTDHEIIIHVKDISGNHLLTIAARAYKDDFILNSYLDKVWGSEERPAKNPVRTGSRTVIIILYDVDGYRVVVNGAQVAFFKHRSTNAAKLFEVHSAQVYKVIYLSTLDIVP